MTTPLDGLDENDCETLRQWEAEVAAYAENLGASPRNLGNEDQRRKVWTSQKIAEDLGEIAESMCGFEFNNRDADGDLGCDDFVELDEDLATFEEQTRDSFSEAVVEGTPSFEADASRAENKRQSVHRLRRARERIGIYSDATGCDIQVETSDNPPQAPMTITCAYDDEQKRQECIDRQTSQFDTPGGTHDDVPWTS